MPADPTDFNVKYGQRLRGQSVGYHIAGAGLTQKWQHQLLMQRVPRALKKPKPEGITYAVKLMVEVQRSIAKTNKTVGTDAMAVTIPRTADHRACPTVSEGCGASTQRLEARRGRRRTS